MAGAGVDQPVGRGLTAQHYIDDVLRPVAVPYVRRHRGMMLQIDNARPHVARQTTQFLRQANNWPALSSDRALLGLSQTADKENATTLLTNCGTLYGGNGDVFTSVASSDP